MSAVQTNFGRLRSRDDGLFDLHLPGGEIIEAQTKERAQDWLDWIDEQAKQRGGQQPVSTGARVSNRGRIQ